MRNPAQIQDPWREMLRKSFSPQQWFVSDDRPEPEDDDTFSQGEERKMYVYRQLEQGLWSVGFYTPDREWVPESDHTTREGAAKRVRWLHGGS